MNLGGVQISFGMHKALDVGQFSHGYLFVSWRLVIVSRFDYLFYHVSECVHVEVLRFG